MKRTIATVAAALVLGTLSGSTAAAESIPARAVSALGIVIATQGDAALLKIRDEIADSARQVVKPFLPAPVSTPDPLQPASTPTAKQ